MDDELGEPLKPWRRTKRRSTSPAKAQKRRDLLAELEALEQSRQRAWASFGLIASLAVGSIVVIKVVVVSRGNTQTALALISGTSASDLLLGIFVAGIWGVVFAFSATLVIFAQRAQELSPQEELRLWTIFAVVLFGLSFAAPWTLPVQFLVLGITFRLIEWRRARKTKGGEDGEEPPSWETFKSTEPKDTELHRIWGQLVEMRDTPLPKVEGVADLSACSERRAQWEQLTEEWIERQELLSSRSRSPLDLVLVGLVILLVVTAMPTLLNDQPWLPAEQIVVDNGDDIVGYVVNYSSDWVTVLINENREIQYLRPSEVERRDVCRLSVLRPRQETIWRMLSREREDVAQYPECA
jgi:hypothetical protein